LRRQDGELDMVPTKQSKKGSVPEKYKLKDHPIFFKNSTIKSVIPKQQTSLVSSSAKQVKNRTLQGEAFSKQVPLALPTQMTP